MILWRLLQVLLTDRQNLDLRVEVITRTRRNLGEKLGDIKLNQ